MADDRASTLAESRKPKCARMFVAARPVLHAPDRAWNPTPNSGTRSRVLATSVPTCPAGGLMKVKQAYRFALDPTPAQERALRSHAGAARFAWNWGLAKCKERYDAEGKWYSAIDLHKLWNAEKKADPALAWWSENSKCAYQEAFRDLDRALQGLH